MDNTATILNNKTELAPVIRRERSIKYSQRESSIVILPDGTITTLKLIREGEHEE